MKIKDSGKRKKFKTGAVRDISIGKGRMDLLPFATLIDISKLYEKGCIKYGERNFSKGIPLDSYVDSAMRHLSKFMDGQIDEGHLIQAAWNILNLIETIIQIENKKLPISLSQKLPFKRVAFIDRIINIKNKKKSLSKTKNRKIKNNNENRKTLSK